MSLRDRNMDWLRKHVWVPAASFGKVISTDQIGISTGTPALLEIGATGYDGFKVDAAGEIASFVMLLPFDMDPGFSLKFRVHGTAEDAHTASDTVTFKGTYNNAKRAAAVVEAATVFDTDFAALTINDTAAILDISGWGVINADKWTRAEIEAGHLIAVGIELDATTLTIATENYCIIGVEYSYVVQLTRGDGSVRDVDAA